MKNAIESLIHETKVIVIVRKLYDENLLKLTDALLEGGLKLIEVTFDQADVACLDKTSKSISLLVKNFGVSMYIGAGTVLNVEQVNAAYSSGASFIIAPNINPSVIRKTKELGMISIPGAMTPTEILSGSENGADYVKVFPAIDLGLSYLQNIKAPINHVNLIATAGITESNFYEYIKAGYYAAGIGGRLCDLKLVGEQRFSEITDRAKIFTQLAKQLLSEE